MTPDTGDSSPILQLGAGRDLKVQQTHFNSILSLSWSQIYLSLFVRVPLSDQKFLYQNRNCCQGRSCHQSRTSVTWTETYVTEIVIGAEYLLPEQKLAWQKLLSEQNFCYLNRNLQWQKFVSEQNICYRNRNCYNGRKC